MSERWPELDPGDRWAIEAFEEQLSADWQTADGLLARARELRAQAESLEIPAMRETTLLLARRYEEAAATRAAASR